MYRMNNTKSKLIYFTYTYARIGAQIGRKPKFCTLVLGFN